MAEMQTNEKKWGEYSTYDDPKYLREEIKEEDLYNKIEKLGGSLFWFKHDYNKPWVTNQFKSEEEQKETLLGLQYNLEFLVYCTKRFGVVFTKEPSVEEHVERTESYDSWYKFWDDHFKNMPDEVYNKFVDAKNNGEDVSKFLPETSWKDTQETPKQIS